MARHDTPGDTPDAVEWPGQLAHELTSFEGLDHVDGEASFEYSGTEFEVTGWLDPEESGLTLAGAIQRIVDAGYEIDQTDEATTGRVRIKASVETDERND